MSSPSLRCTAFSGPQRIATGELRHVAMKAKQAYDLHPERPVLVFDDADGRTVEVPLELPAADLLRLLAQPQLAASTDAAPAPRKPGRPKLGVVAREITLLPRHWDWLAAQPGGASVALRRLVEDARKVSSADDRRRAAQEATFRFMQAMAGDAPGFEDASRALFAGDVSRFEGHVARWADDVRDHAMWLATDAFGS
ncbi:DUF2239 family protein [Thermomonas carbonis]|uniref:DUF2239 family protein n=1 Tax=Thermomonas carbonis TaxID=1463158 RepID=A0A7G9ST79_9GAMM|nr:DUF2239 family protein [Thermomonas carbonis]QNN71054.1 DUF2239 family protein [Thermomonas carbonis]GHC04224.1 hypothetical protein GCM10010080_18270 [Thermomonas carbonis]